jgi:hypothetical protein
MLLQSPHPSGRCAHSSQLLCAVNTAHAACNDISRTYPSGCSRQADADGRDLWSAAPGSIQGSMASSHLPGPLSRDLQPSFSGRTAPVYPSTARTHLPRVRRQQLRGTASSALVLSIQGSNLPSDGQQEQQDLPPFERPLLPKPDKLGPIKPEKDKPLVRVQLSVHYRVHSRQILCIGGSQIPFGWSFLSIAKVPMTWNRGDVWTCEAQPRFA